MLCCHIYRHQLPIKTDHKSLEGLLREKKAVPTLTAPRIQRWVLTRAGYEYTIQYKAGKSNRNSDAFKQITLSKDATVNTTVLLFEHLEETLVNSTKIRFLISLPVVERQGFALTTPEHFKVLDFLLF